MIKLLDGVDDKIGGGLLPGSISFLTGLSCSGKTMFLSEFVDTSIRNDKKVIVYVSEENWENGFKFLKVSMRDRVINNVLEEENKEIETKIKIKKIDTSKTKMSDLLEIILEDISYHKPDLIFIDDLGNFITPASPINKRPYGNAQMDLKILFEIIKKSNSSLVFTHRSSINMSGIHMSGPSTMSHSADFIILVDRKEEKFNLKFIKSHSGKINELVKYNLNSSNRLELSIN